MTELANQLNFNQNQNEALSTFHSKPLNSHLYYKFA